MVTSLNNPLINHKVAQFRDKRTSSGTFRRLVKEIALLMLYEVSKNFESNEIEIETPLSPCNVNILLQASIGHSGLYRDEKNFSTS